MNLLFLPLFRKKKALQLKRPLRLKPNRRKQPILQNQLQSVLLLTKTTTIATSRIQVSFDPLNLTKGQSAKSIKTIKFIEEEALKKYQNRTGRGRKSVAAERYNPEDDDDDDEPLKGCFQK